MRYLKFVIMSICASAMAALVGCAAPQTDDQVVKTVCANTDLKLDTYSQKSLLGVGYKALVSNNFECAERLLLRAQSMDPKDPYAALNLGVLYHQTQRLQQAREAYEKVILLEKMQPEKNKETVKVSMDKDQSIGVSAGEVARKNLNMLR